MIDAPTIFVPGELTTEARVMYGRAPIDVSPYGPGGVVNPYYGLNLPYDYLDLSESGRKMARLNGIRLQGPEPEKFLRSWMLFDTYYLRQLPDGVFYKDLLPSPPAHYESVLDLAKFQLNAWAYPRGSGKSTLLGKGIPLLMLTSRVNYDILMVLAKDDFVSRRFSSLMFQLEHNKFIKEDFGDLKPPRGAKQWNHHALQLNNNNQIVGIPVEGKMLGERPDLMFFDDPEHNDATVMTPNASGKREAMERLLFGNVMPMLRRGSCLGWIGTLLDATSYLYYIMYSNDPKFAYWNRRVYGGISDEGNLFWKERWSKEDLQRLREEWGDEYFETHMMNRPGGSKRPFRIHPDYCTYRVSNIDEKLIINPFESQATIHATRPVTTEVEGVFSPQPTSRTYGETVGGMFRMMLVDWAFSRTTLSDFSCIIVLGYENSAMFKDTLWVLDIWLGKENTSEVVNKILSLAQKWRVRVIGSEAVGAQQAIAEQIQGKVDSAAGHMGFRPGVLHLKAPSQMSKDEKICNMVWRFNKYRIRLPIEKRYEWPWKELFEQLEQFSPGTRGLPHDDAIDALAMSQLVGKPNSLSHMAPAGERPIDPVERLKAGEIIDPRTGIPWASMVSLEQLPLKEMATRWQQKKIEEDGSQSLYWVPTGAV